MELVNEIIKSPGMKRHFFSQIVGRNHGNDLGGFMLMQKLAKLSINERTTWTLLEGEILAPEWADNYKSKYGEWMHCGGHSISHNRLGMAYAWWLLEIRKYTHFQLRDTPDFFGTTPNDQIIAGDIGICSPTAFLHGLQAMNVNDIWVSVVNYTQQIIIEFHYDVSAIIANNLEAVR